MNMSWNMISAGVYMLAVICFFSSGCSQQTVQRTAEQDTITVFSGGGVRGPVSECAGQFERQAGIRVKTVFGSSRGMMERACSEKGDMYIAGDIQYVENAKQKGKVLSSRSVCSVVPVLAASPGNPKRITKLRDLGRPGVRFFLVNAEKCQQGILCERLLAEQGISAPVLKANRVSVIPEGKTPASMLASGELDAVLVWEHGVRKMKLDADILRPPELTDAAVPVSAVVFRSVRSSAAQQFLDFLCSSRGKEIFRRHGFRVVDGADADVLHVPDYKRFGNTQADRFSTVAGKRPTVYSGLASYLVKRFDLEKRQGIGIDIGSGPGDLIVELASRTEQFYWIDADINTWYMRHLCERCEKAGVSHRTGFVFADACALPFKSGYADLAVSRGCYQFWPDLELGLREVRRVLKPGGEAFIGRGFPPDMPEGEVRNLFSRKIVGGPKYNPDTDAERFKVVMKKLDIKEYEVIRHIPADRSLNYGVWLYFKKD